MPHKRAKRSIREQAKSDRKLDLSPSETTSFASEDIPKSMARVLNAEAIQSAWRAKKRSMDEAGGDGGNSKRKKRRTESTSTKTEIKIKPGESLRHFKRRVEDDMRPIIRSAMKNTTSVSKQKLKQSQKDAARLANVPTPRKNESAGHGDIESDSGDMPAHRGKRKRKGDREPSPDFVRVSSSTPKRLNDVAQAPPQLKDAPRLKRLVQKAQRQKAEIIGGITNGANNVITLQQKRMMELEREKAINRYRALKDARLKAQKEIGVSI